MIKQALTIIFSSMILISCSEKQEQKLNKENYTQENLLPLIITAIDSKFPLRLDEINFEDKNTIIHLNDTVISKIEEVIKDYAKDIEFYDSTQTYRDTYINTIRLHDSLQTVFLILLKHYPTAEVNSKVLFYDNKKKEFARKTHDFKLYALYNFDKGKLTPTGLKTEFKITSPEIDIIDINKDGINDYKLVRLWHNGTFNAIHKTVLTIKNSNIDTISIDKTSI